MKTTKLTTFGKVSVAVALGLSALPAAAQTYIYSQATASASHSNAYDSGTDSEWFEREGAAPFGRLTANADSDSQDSAYNGFGRAWSEVGVGGVHVYATGQSVGRLVGPLTRQWQQQRQRLLL